MASIRQTSFSAGELAPTLHGRTDLDEYAKGLARCYNMIPTPHGSVVNRPGTLYLKDAHGAVGGYTSQLIPFAVNGYTDVLLELTAGAIYILDAYGNNVAAAIANTFTQTFGWQVAQVGLVMTLASPTNGTWELQLTLPNTWTLTEVSYAVLAPYFGGGYPAILAPVPVADPTHFNREWTWKVTAVVQNTSTGEVFETGAYTVTQVVTKGGGAWTYVAVAAQYPVYIDMPVTIDWANEAGVADYQPTGWNTHNVIAYRVYRGRGAAFGYVGESTSTQFIDYGEAPNITQQPPLGTNPFLVKTYTGATDRIEKPTVVTYHDQRRLFALAGSIRSNTIWASATGRYTDYDMPFRVVPLASDALEISLAGKYREDIRHMLSMERLLIFTSSGVWMVSGPNGDGLNAADVNMGSVLSYVGVTPLPAPLRVNNSVFYQRAALDGIQHLTTSAEGRIAFTPTDASILARHLFVDETGISENPTIASWDYAAYPYNVIWAARGDGLLLSFTYVPETKTYAWAQHETEGLFEQVAVVRTGGRDEVFFIVSRNEVRFLEKMENRTDLPNVSFLDSSIYVVSSSPVASGAVTVTGLAHFNGTWVYASTGQVSSGPYAVSGGSAVIPNTDSVVTSNDVNSTFSGRIGYRFDSELELLDVAAGRTETKTRLKLVREVTFEVEASKGLWSGETFEHLHEWRQRQTADSYGAIPAYTGSVTIPIRSTWNKGGRAVLRQVDPLPLTVLGVTREVEFGGT